MKRTSVLFAVLSATCVLWAFKDALGSPYGVPVAICENNVCTMSQKDYDQLKAFHKAVMTSAIEAQNDAARMESELSRARRAALSCLYWRS